MAIDSAGFWNRLQEVFSGANAPEIARLTGRTKQTVYRWRDGQLPDLDVLTEIAESRAVSLHWLVTGKGTKRVQTGEFSDAINTGQANEGASVSDVGLIVESPEELHDLLKLFLAQQELIAIFNASSPRVRAEILAVAKGIAFPESIPIARAVDSGTKARKKAS